VRTIWTLLLLAACAAPAARSAHELEVTGRGGDRATIAQRMNGAPYAVVTFFSAECPVQKAHDARLRQLAIDYGPRGVAFFAVDTDPSATPESSAAAARTRSLPFPILIDKDAALVRLLDAEFSTFSVVLDARGRVLYRGGIDSDRVHLKDGARLYLRDALDDVLAGRQVRVAVTEALGCPIERR
jgi:peroxiredoxin